MDTVGDLVQDVRRQLFGMQRPEYNVLAAPIDDHQVTFSLGIDPVNVSVGSLLALDDELVYVFKVTGTTVTVHRAMLGSDAAAHAGDILVEVNPQFSDIIIRDALRAEIVGWAPRVAAIATYPLSVISGARDVDLEGVPADFVEILEVLRSPRAAQNSWIPIGFRVERNMDLLDFPSGSALFLDNEGEKQIDLRVTVLEPFDVSAFGDPVELADVGMAPSQHDIAVLGALWRLVISREVKRNFIEAQGDPRSAQEVPAGAIANSGRVLKVLRDERLREEMNRIRSMYLPRRR